MMRIPDPFPELRGRILELRVLQVNESSFIGEPLDGAGTQEIEAEGSHHLIEGEIACIAEEAPGTGRFEIAGFRVDPSFLPGPRQAMEEVGDGEFEFSDLPQEDSEALDQALEYWRSGDPEGGAAALRGILGRSPRMIDTWHHLGMIEEEIGLETRAPKYYLTGWELGLASLPEGFEGRLPWSFINNRPFLRAGHGLGLSRLRDGFIMAAVEVFERILRLNPEDNQGIRFILAPLYLQEGLPDRARALFSTCPPDGMNLFVAAVLELLSGHRRDAAAQFLSGITQNVWAPLYLMHLLDEDEHEHEEDCEHLHEVVSGSPEEAKESLREIRDLWDDAGGPALFRILIESEEFVARYSRILDIEDELGDLPVGPKRSEVVRERYDLFAEAGIEAMLRSLTGRL